MRPWFLLFLCCTASAAISAGTTLALLTKHSLDTPASYIAHDWMYRGTEEKGKLHLQSNTSSPTLFSDKQVSNHRRDTKWDTGNVYRGSIRTEGDGNLVGDTNYVEVDTSCDGNCTGDNIAQQNRVRLESSNAKGWAGWDYLDISGRIDKNRPIAQGYGREINIHNDGPDTGWMYNIAPGASVGLVVATADHKKDSGGSGVATQAIRVSRNTGNGWHSGLLVAPNSILPTDAQGNNEAMRIAGATVPTKAYGGLSIGSWDDGKPQKNYLEYGIRLLEAVFSKGALEMAYGQYLAWGGDKTTSGPARLTVTPQQVFEFSGQGMRIPVVDTLPASASEGTLTYVRGDGLKLYDGKVWVALPH